MARPPGVTEFLTTDQLFSQPRWEDPLNEQERKALLEIGKAPKISPKEVGQIINSEKDMMSKITKKLLQLGYVFERKSPEDRRFTQLGMTNKGEAAMNEWVQYKYNKSPGTFKITNIQTWEGEEQPVPAEKPSEG